MLSEKVRNNIEAMWKKSGKVAIYTCMVVAFLAYYYFLREETLNADCLNEGWLIYHNDAWALSLGRWAIPWIQKLCFHIVSPMLMMMFYIVCVAAVSMMLIDLWDIEGKLRHILVSASLMVAPAMVMQFTYFYLGTAFSFALLFSVLAAYLLGKYKGYISACIASTCLVFSLGLYQAYIGVFCAIILFTILKDVLKCNWDKSKSIKQLFRISISTIVGGGIYWIVLKICLRLNDISLSSYGGADSVGYNTILRNLSVSTKNAYSWFQNYYNDMVLHRNFFWITIIGIALLILIENIIDLMKKRKYFYVIILMVCIGVLPLGMNVICIIVPTYSASILMSFQMQLMIPFMLCLCSIKCSNRGGRQLQWYMSLVINISSIVLIAFLIWSYIFSAYSTYRTKEIGSRYINYVVGEALSEVRSRDDYDESVPIVFAGFVDETVAQRKNVLKGYSYVEESDVFWKAKYEVFACWPGYCSYYFGVDIHKISIEEYDALTADESFLNMPLYPSKKGVSKIDEYYVIKLSEK